MFSCSVRYSLKYYDNKLGIGQSVWNVFIDTRNLNNAGKQVWSLGMAGMERDSYDD